MSSSVEREEEGRGATDFFRMGLGRLEDRDRDKRGRNTSQNEHKKKAKIMKGRIVTKELYPATNLYPTLLKMNLCP